MALQENEYDMLESIVGPENISDDPAILDGYAFQFFGPGPMGAEEVSTEKLKWAPRPEAVILPESVEEVQAIVKLCNKQDLKYKAHSTGWGDYAAPGMEGVIQLDLRRMDGILEINEEGMYAVVEPYVTFSQLQAEAMKKGLNVPMIGAGGNCSPLASVTSMKGEQWYGPQLGYNDRNLLATEWVSPTGEIVGVGSLGSGAGWFCGDGPGPSLRGIIRGHTGAMGGLGVFTKAAIRLFDWPGPPEIEVEGQTPALWWDYPDNLNAYFVSFPGWEELADFGYKVGEAEIAYFFTKISAPMLGIAAAKNIMDVGAEMVKEVFETMDEMTGYTVLVVTAAYTPEEAEYQEKVMEEIIDETGGTERMDIFSRFDLDKFVVGGMMRASITDLGVFAPGGAFYSTHGAVDTWDFATTEGEVGEEIKKKYIEKGVIVDDGADNAWGQTYEQAHMGHLEELTLYDPSDSESLEGLIEYVEECDKKDFEEHVGHPFCMAGDRYHDWFGPEMCNYQIWQRKIKKTFDPNNTSDPSSYISPKDD